MTTYLINQREEKHADISTTRLYFDILEQTFLTAINSMYTYIYALKSPLSMIVQMTVNIRIYEKIIISKQ